VENLYGEILGFAFVSFANRDDFPVFISSIKEMCDNPEVVNWPVDKLLMLDNGTSQWASAAILLGGEGNIEMSSLPFKAKLSLEALKHWKERRKKGLLWEPRYDETIHLQAISFIELIKTGKLEFEPNHSEDYCFARAFNIMTKEQGGEKWPSLKGHESDRLVEMEKYLICFEKGDEIDSKDHRMIQAIAMLGKFKNKNVKFSHPGCVSKTWPQFWDFLRSV